MLRPTMQSAAMRTAARQATAVAHTTRAMAGSATAALPRWNAVAACPAPASASASSSPSLAHRRVLHTTARWAAKDPRDVDIDAIADEADDIVDDAEMDALLQEDDADALDEDGTGAAGPAPDADGDAEADAKDDLEEEVEEPRQNLKPSELVTLLDKYIVGQLPAKKSVAVALRNRWRRHHVKKEGLRADITPKNILMVGPTGCGKTEIARRLAVVTDSPFIKVEATKFTEVGFYGKDVDSIVKDLVRVAIAQLKAKKKTQLIKQMAGRVEDQILTALHRTRAKVVHAAASPASQTGAPKPTLDWSDVVRKRALVTAKADTVQWAADSEAYRKGDLDAQQIEIPLPPKRAPAPDMFGGMGRSGEGGDEAERDDRPRGDFEGLSFRLVGMGLLGGQGKDDNELVAKLSTVGEARAALLEHHTASRLRTRDLAKRAIRMVESDGIVFLDEIDKIVTSAASRRFSASGDASAEGVQRDLLPLVEGTTVSTPHGPVNTEHILFICSGAFHAVNVGDMLPELQGRLPVRVELKALTEEDFYRILTVPTNNLIMQQTALLKTDNVELVFTDPALREIARVACEVNRTLENIGARRLNTVIQRIMDEYSFTAADLPAGTRIEIGVEYVLEKIKPLMKNTDLSKYVL